MEKKTVKRDQMSERASTINSDRTAAMEPTAENIAASLRKRPRFGETIIQTFLFVAGFLSILTTIGIVYVLATESIHFFTRLSWEEANKELETTISATDTIINVSETGRSIKEGQLIRIGNSDEHMAVVSVNGQTITVIRGTDDTLAINHPAGSDIFFANEVTLWQFVSGTKWNPQIGQFGIWPLLNATLLTSSVAMLVALPLGLCVAIYLSEYATLRARVAS